MIRGGKLVMHLDADTFTATVGRDIGEALLRILRCEGEGTSWK